MLHGKKKGQPRLPFLLPVGYAYRFLADTMSVSTTTQKLARNVTAAVSALELQLNSVAGFSHLSYQKHWHNFPNSLVLSCFFHTDAGLQKFLLSPQEALIRKAFQSHFLKVGIKFRQANKNLVFLVIDDEAL